MFPRPVQKVTLFFAAAGLLALSLHHGFGKAWESQYIDVAAAQNSAPAAGEASAASVLWLEAPQQQQQLLPVPRVPLTQQQLLPVPQVPLAQVQPQLLPVPQVPLAQVQPQLLPLTQVPLTQVQQQPVMQLQQQPQLLPLPQQLPAASAARPLSSRTVEYQIDVHLHADTKRLHGTQTVTWTNPGKVAVSDLFFHLYPNAFASPESTFMRESGGKLREDKATSSSTGFMQLELLQTIEGQNLLPRLHYVQPDDRNTSDSTLATLRLPTAVAPGESVTLKLGFLVQLPEVFARMGYKDDFIMAGQWFPKLAKYETAGMRGRAQDGWVTHQYHGNSEFYSDFGMYAVNIQVPDGYEVAATGFPIKAATVKAQTRTYHYYAEDVHDFAWAASPDFVYAEEAFSPDGVSGVRIKLYLDPRHAHLQDRYMHAAQTTLAKLTEWYGSYPYSTLSVVVPPSGAGGAGGMEYPTLVTAFAADADEPGYALEQVVVHEIAHQYWYGMVASNEFEEAWLDEGFTSYTEDKVLASAYGLEPNLKLEASYMTDPAPLKQFSWSYGSHERYAENVYMRAKLVLVGMDRLIGEEQMRKVLRTYFQKYRFRHPSTADFQRVVEQVTGQRWDRYFQQYVYGDLMADFAVESIHVQPVKQEDSMIYESVVLIRKRGGDFGTQVPLLFRFEDGTLLPKQWETNDKTSHIQYKLRHSAPLSWAAVDPNGSIVLDNKRMNNFMKAQLPARPAVRWNLSVVKVLEGLLGALAW